MPYRWGTSQMTPNRSRVENLAHIIGAAQRCEHHLCQRVFSHFSVTRRFLLQIGAVDCIIYHIDSIGWRLSLKQRLYSIRCLIECKMSWHGNHMALALDRRRCGYNWEWIGVDNVDCLNRPSRSFPQEAMAILYNDIISLEILSSCYSCEAHFNSGEIITVQGQGLHVSATCTRI